MNLIQIYGRAGGPVQLQDVGKTLVGKFGVATNHRYTKATGDVSDTTTWHNVVAWGKLAEAACQQIDKGTEVFVVGRMDHRTYEKKDGTKGYTSELVAERIFLGLKPPKPAAPVPAPAVPQQSELDMNPDDLPF